MSKRERFAFIAAVILIAVLWIIAAALRDEVSYRRALERELKQYQTQGAPCALATRLAR